MNDSRPRKGNLEAKRNPVRKHKTRLQDPKKLKGLLWLGRLGHSFLVGQWHGKLAHCLVAGLEQLRDSPKPAPDSSRIANTILFRGS